jgi:hypothetical protein
MALKTARLSPFGGALEKPLAVSLRILALDRLAHEHRAHWRWRCHPVVKPERP